MNIYSLKKFNNFKIFIILITLIVLSGCGERNVVITSDWEDFKKKNEDKFKEKELDPFIYNTIDISTFESDKSIKSPGDPRAIKGGTLKMAMSDFPSTYRTIGKDTNYMILSLMEGLIYESLLSFDAETLEYKSGLAVNWKISDDKKEYFFKINPLAKWSDGIPVTSNDIIATFNLITDQGIKDPAVTGMFLENFEPPIAISRDIIKVKCKKENWRSFMYFAGLSILPAHHIKKVDGETFLKKYQYQMMPGTGPYELSLNETRKDAKLVLKRRQNFWGEALLQNKGLFNFDKIEFLVINDERLQLEKFKKGEFDIYIPSRAKWWNEDLTAKNFELIERGIVQKKKVFNYKPLGMSGLAFNTDVEPFNDKNVRKAFSMLWNKDQLIEKLFFNEYVQCKSYFQGTIYENNENITLKYNVEKALDLLKNSGWGKNENDGFLYKNGEKFEIDLRIESYLNNIFTSFQQDLQNAGIKLNLINMTSQSVIENMMKKNFQITFIGWTGLLFPNPESSMHSKYAKLNETNNITGISIKRIDEICDLYDKCYDIKKRITLLKELDKIATDEFHYAFGWVAPYAARFCYYNKFGFPNDVLTYTGDWRSIPALWWIDSEKNRKVEKAKTDKSIKMEIMPEISDPYKKYKAG